MKVDDWIPAFAGMTEVGSRFRKYTKPFPANFPVSLCGWSWQSLLLFTSKSIAGTAAAEPPSLRAFGSAKLGRGGVTITK